MIIYFFLYCHVTIRGNFKTQPPVDRWFLLVPATFYSSQQWKPPRTGRNHWSIGIYVLKSLLNQYHWYSCLKYFFFLKSTWEHTWSGRKVQDSWSLDHQCCPTTTSVFVSLSKIYQFAMLTRVHLGPVVCGEYYNLSADRACTWPVAIHPR